jgi:regulator of protease activity HflC (stomatin/prohibitin superfamily)
MKIKNIMLVLLMVIVSFGTVACSKVPAGTVGVKVYLLGGEKGVDKEILGPGRYFIGWNEELFLFPTWQQNYVWTKDVQPGSETDESITFQTAEGLTVNADVGITYSVDPNKIPDLFQKYRRGLPEITDTFLRNMVRDSINGKAGKMNVESVYGSGKQDLIDAVQVEITEHVRPFGIIIEKIYLVGEFRLPEVVVDALNAKISATQKAQQRENEVAQAKAEADKEIAVARGVAESNLIKAKSLTPELLKWEELAIQKIQSEKWDGKLPTTVLGGNTGTLLQLNK